MGTVSRMSDLQCPARILVARHGEAKGPGPGLLADAGGRLTGPGRSQAAALAARLEGENVAAVYTSRLGPAVETGAILAAALGTTAIVVDGVHDLAVGDLAVGTAGAETGDEVVSRFRAALDELADRHRGETVVVVSHGGVMSPAVPHVAVPVSSAGSRDSLLEQCAVVSVEIDADGWRVKTPWPGRRWSGAAEVTTDEASEQAGSDVVDAS